MLYDIQNKWDFWVSPVEVFNKANNYKKEFAISIIFWPTRSLRTCFNTLEVGFYVKNLKRFVKVLEDSLKNVDAITLLHQPKINNEIFNDLYDIEHISIGIDKFLLIEKEYQKVGKISKLFKKIFRIKEKNYIKSIKIEKVVKIIFKHNNLAKELIFDIKKVQAFINNLKYELLRIELHNKGKITLVKFESDIPKSKPESSIKICKF